MKNRLAQKMGKESTEYYTDEEELARETQWIRMKGKNYKKKATRHIIHPTIKRTFRTCNSC